MDRVIVLAPRDLHGAPVAVDRPGVAQSLRRSLSPGAGKSSAKAAAAVSENGPSG